MTRRGRPKRTEPTAREVQMIEMARAGLTLQQIGDRFDITRERVRQLVSKWGVARSERGFGLRGRVRAQAKVAAREARCQAKYGCSYGAWLSIGPRGRNAFRYQARDALYRGIQWKLSLGQWWEIWQRSGHWADRGRGNKYCMARIADGGAYEFGNVYICTGRENGREYAARKNSGRSKPSRTAARGVYLLYPGARQPFVAHVGSGKRRYFATVSEAIAARAAAGFSEGGCA